MINSGYTTAAEVRRHLGTTCTIIGRYELVEIENQKRQAWRTWPTLVLADGTHVALESVWDTTKQPSAVEVERWRGRRVAVTGVLHGQPPTTSPANLALLTISPVQSIEVIEP